MRGWVKVQLFKGPGSRTSPPDSFGEYLANAFPHSYHTESIYKNKNLITL